MGNVEVLPFDCLFIARERVLLLYFLYYGLLFFFCRFGDILSRDNYLLLLFRFLLTRFLSFLRDDSPVILSLLMIGKRFSPFLLFFLILTAHIPHFESTTIRNNIKNLDNKLAVSLKIPQLVKLDQALLKVDVLLFINAEWDDVLCVDGESIGDLVVASHGCAHLLYHGLSETAFFEVIHTGV